MYEYIPSVRWRFTTEKAPPIPPVGITEMQPEAGSHAVAVDSPISFKFDAEMDISSISEHSIYLSSGDLKISATVNYNSDSRKVIVIPERKLEAGKEYTVNVTGDVEDKTGRKITPTRWVFCTASSLDLKVVSHEPKTSGSEIPTETAITLKFNSDIDPSTLNDQNCVLMLSSSLNRIPCVFNYDVSSFMLVLTPTSKLMPDTDYTVKLTSGLKNLDGKNLVPFSWNFHTAASKPDTVKVMMNGKYISFTDAQPCIMNDRILIPFRTLFEKLGAYVSWDQGQQKVNASLDNNSIELVVGKKQALYNNQQVSLDVAPIIINDRVLIPLRFASESLGLKVDWQAASYTVVITH
jgi:hypothetical protein